MAEATTKVCSKCKEEKPLSKYHKDKDKTLGVKSACKECLKPYFKAYNKDYYERNKDRMKVQQINYYNSNKEVVNERHRKHYHENKDANREKKKKYAKENRHLYNANHARRKSLQAQSVPKHLRKCPKEKHSLSSVYLLAKIISQHTGVLHHVDHMWPISDGGPHWSGNLQIITATDNFKKNATVCEDVKRTVKESLEWEIQRYNNEKSDTRNS